MSLTVVNEGSRPSITIQTHATIGYSGFSGFSGRVGTNGGTGLSGFSGYSGFGQSGAIGISGFSGQYAHPVVNADVASNADIAVSKLEAAASGQIIVGQDGAPPEYKTVSGDITLNEDGVVAIASGVIVDADISNDADIAVAKLQDGESGQIVIGQGSGTPSYQAVSGNATLANTGVLTITSLPEIDASALYNYDCANLSGTLPNAVFPAILPAVSGENLTGLVPYTGAVADLDLGAFNLTTTGQVTASAINGAGQMITGLQAGNIQAGGTLPALDGNALTNLPNFIGDSGSGGTAGVVPAPMAGDGAAGRVLKADATWGQVNFWELGGIIRGQVMLVSGTATITLAAPGFSLCCTPQAVSSTGFIVATDNNDNTYTLTSSDPADGRLINYFGVFCGA